MKKLNLKLLIDKRDEDMHLEGKKPSRYEYGRWGNGKPLSFLSSMIIASIIIIVGIVCFIFVSTPNKTTAYVTNTMVLSDSDGYYEGYDFYYVYDGKTYTGHGNKDLNKDGTFKIKVGDTKKIYLHIYDDSKYELSDKSGYSLLCLFVFCGMGLLIMINSIRIFIKHKKVLAEIGDANGDGKVNEKDLDYSDGYIQEENIGNEAFHKIKHIDDK